MQETKSLHATVTSKSYENRQNVGKYLEIIITMSIEKNIHLRFAYDPILGVLRLKSGRKIKMLSQRWSHWWLPRIAVNGQPVTIQRVAWTLANGYTQKAVRPKNGDRYDIRLCNLHISSEPDVVTPLSLWLMECIAPGRMTLSSRMCAAYPGQLGRETFHRIMRELGMTTKRTAAGVFYIGLVPPENYQMPVIQRVEGVRPAWLADAAPRRKAMVLMGG